MNNEQLFLSSEVAQLKELIDNLPKESLIERISLQSRLANIQKELELLPKYNTEKVKLTFNGKPVKGSHGIAADFASKAAGFFADSFSTIWANLNENLSNTGPLPRQDKGSLLITGTALGSFGFEFELPPTEPSLLSDQPTPKQAINKLSNLMRLTVEGSDDEVTEAIEEIHSRAVNKVYSFMEYLAQQQAWCTLESGDTRFGFSGYEQLKTSSERLKSENINESEQTFLGQFTGVLPDSRTFEFLNTKNDEIIKGKLDKRIVDTEVLNKKWLYKNIEVTFDVIQVGQGKPRYTLNSLDKLKLTNI